MAENVELNEQIAKFYKITVNFAIQVGSGYEYGQTGKTATWASTYTS